ncbi:triphosphoribosyl-dephospho-CoA synthase [Methyloraptor flagellatus]|uniref:Triphosphoribosyl-dephospho-CoA synthase n=1 Tax=Methyloraptor flagellatus TaxID=3162530 RepID=A0AAU7XAJ2_9HYPH
MTATGPDAGPSSAGAGPVPPPDAAIDPLIRDAFLAACRAELQALKPGNVHVHAPGHRMTVADFEASAAAAAPFVARRGASVGRRVREGVEATFAAVGTNTNLGILLLSAPLAVAAERRAAALAQGRASPFRAVLGQVLAELGPGDARDVFAAIRLANPGGLGAAEEHDVRAEPTAGLMEAMRAAADRDSIAAAYAENFEALYRLGLPVIGALDHGAAILPDTVTEIFLTYLSALPDSHVVRKWGKTVAEEVRLSAAEYLQKRGSPGFEHSLLGWDSALKARGINPGTSADLTVATIFLHLIDGDK